MPQALQVGHTEQYWLQEALTETRKLTVSVILLPPSKNSRWRQYVLRSAVRPSVRLLTPISCDAIPLLSGAISMKLGGTNIHYSSGHC